MSTGARTPVLMVEDDPRLAALVREYLEQNGFEVEVVADGARVLDALRRKKAEVVLLDLMLPGLDGLEVCRRIRAEPALAQVAIIMATARGDDVDKIVGLELGADDYLAKPYNPRELVARIRAVLRRAVAVRAAPAERIAVGELAIDLGARVVTVGARAVALTFFEFELLVVLARAAGRVLSREHLYDVLKGEAFESFDRSIDVHVSKLRAKLEADPKAPKWIRTVRGVGYVLARDGA
ncbi:MAG: response regulator transcription factor [Myxococcota bacterium]